MIEAGITYVAIGPYAWGASGKSPEAALKQLRKSWHSLYAGPYSRKKTACLKVTGEWRISQIDGAVTARTIETLWKPVVKNS